MIDTGECEYEATRPGGYIAGGTPGISQPHAHWQLWIERDGITKYYDEFSAPPCQPVGFIKRGDTVRVALARPGPQRLVASHDYIAAGANYHC